MTKCKFEQATNYMIPIIWHCGEKKKINCEDSKNDCQKLGGMMAYIEKKRKILDQWIYSLWEYYDRYMSCVYVCVSHSVMSNTCHALVKTHGKQHQNQM